ncbi:MAG: hypothetical protein J6E48_04645 [Prevotella sp.]|nr:hypothetical protein [Prevotella sp.]
MTDEEKLQFLAKIVSGGHTKIGQIIMDNHGTMNINQHDKESGSDNKLSECISADMVGEALSKCGDYVWGNSAYAVAFCVCRDLYGWEDNASLFERKMELEGIDLPPGTINATISRNPYMRLPVSKWQDKGVKERVLKFKNAFQQNIGIPI